MKSIPFELPESLKSYLVTFRESPGKGISNLEKHVTKRRNDAIGYLLLALLYHKSGDRIKAGRAATQARTLAPGSTMLENLHYFLSHPDGFDAWVPGDDLKRVRGKDKISNTPYDVALDLDTLISRLTRANQKRIRISEESVEHKFLEHTPEVEQLATPTLALIYEKQKKYEEAIRMYRQLIENRPDEADRFRIQITRLEALL